MLLVLLAGLMSCSNLYTLNPNYNKKAHVISHLKFDEAPKSIVKIASKKYLVIDDIEIREVDANTNQIKVIAKNKFKDEVIQTAAEFDGNLLVITFYEELIKAYLLNKTTLEVVKSNVLHKDKDDDLIAISIKISESKKFASIVYAYDSPYDTKDYGLLSFDSNLNVISDKKWNLEDDICEDGKYSGNYFSGHYIDNQGVSTLVVPIEYDDRWTLKIFSLNNKEVSVASYTLPQSVNGYELDDNDYKPRYSEIVELKNGNLLIATIVNESLEDWKCLNLIQIDKKMKVINEFTYRMDESKAKEIFSSKDGKASMIQGVFEDKDGNITLFIDCVKELNAGASSGSRRNPVPTRGNTSMIYSTYYPISILNFDKNFKLNWDKYINRDFSYYVSSSGEIFGRLNTYESKFTFFKENDAISFTHPSLDEKEFEDAKQVLRTINNKGELSNPIPLYEASDLVSMIGGVLYKEDDGSYSYFTSFKSTIGYNFDFVNVKFDK